MARWTLRHWRLRCAGFAGQTVPFIGLTRPHRGDCPSSLPAFGPVAVDQKLREWLAAVEHQHSVRNFCLRLRVERRGTGRCGLKDVASYPCALAKRAKEHLIISQNWMATSDDIGRRQVLSVSHTISSSSLISREPRCLAAPLMHIHFVMQSRAGSGLLMPKRSSCQRGPRGQRCRIGFCRRIPQNCHMRRMSS